MYNGILGGGMVLVELRVQLSSFSVYWLSPTYFKALVSKFKITVFKRNQKESRRDMDVYRLRRSLYSSNSY